MPRYSIWLTAQPRRGILENLEEEDPDMVEQIRRLMFVFEDLILVNDKGIQATLKEVENDENNNRILEEL